MWVNPQRLRLDKSQSMTHELIEKLDKREKRLAEVIVNNKAHSLAIIQGGWLERVTEELFDQGKTLAEIREYAGKQNPYLLTREFESIEEEFEAIAAEQLTELNQAKADAQEALDRQVGLVIEGKASDKTDTEMQKAQAAINTAEKKLEAFSKQVSPSLFVKLTRPISMLPRAPLSTLTAASE